MGSKNISRLLWKLMPGKAVSEGKNKENERIRNFQLEAEDFIVLRDCRTTKVKCLNFLNHHFPLIGKSTMDCYTSKNKDRLESLKYGSSFAAAASDSNTDCILYVPRSYNVRFPSPVK